MPVDDVIRGLIAQKANLKSVEYSEMKEIMVRISRVLPHWLRIVGMPEGIVARLTGKDKYSQQKVVKAIFKNFVR